MKLPFQSKPKSWPTVPAAVGDFVDFARSVPERLDGPRSRRLPWSARSPAWRPDSLSGARGPTTAPPSTTTRPARRRPGRAAPRLSGHPSGATSRRRTHPRRKRWARAASSLDQGDCWRSLSRIAAATSSSRSAARSESGFTSPRSADQAAHQRGAIMRGARRSIPFTIVAPATSSQPLREPARECLLGPLRDRVGERVADHVRVDEPEVGDTGARSMGRELDPQRAAERLDASLAHRVRSSEHPVEERVYGRDDHDMAPALDHLRERRGGPCARRRAG